MNKGQEIMGSKVGFIKKKKLQIKKKDYLFSKTKQFMKHMEGGGGSKDFNLNHFTKMFKSIRFIVFFWDLTDFIFLDFFFYQILFLIGLETSIFYEVVKLEKELSWCFTSR